MKVYVVFDMDDHITGAGFILAAFTNFQKARECAIRAVDDGLCDAGTIYVDSYDGDTGEADRAWDYGELIDGGEVVC